jgi:hypothetical protein
LFVCGAGFGETFKGTFAAVITESFIVFFEENANYKRLDFVACGLATIQ